MTVDEAKAVVEDMGSEVGFYDNIADAFIGLGSQAHKHVAVYDTCRAINVFVGHLTEECDVEGHVDCEHELEAVEWFDYNVVSAWHGDVTPIFVEACLDPLYGQMED